MKRYSNYLLSVMFSVSIVGSSLWASTFDFEQELLWKSDFQDFYFQNSDDSTAPSYLTDSSVNTLLDMQGSLSLSNLNNLGNLPSQDNSNIQSTVTLQDTTVNTPAREDAIITATADNATPAQSIASTHNTSTVVKQRKKRKRTGYNPLSKSLLRHLSVIDRKGISEPLFWDAVKKLNLTCVVDDKNRGRTGLLNALELFDNAMQKYNKAPNNESYHRDYARYRSYLRTVSESCNSSTLSEFNNNEQKNMIDVLDLIGQHYGGPLEVVTQNIHARFQGDLAALAAVPSILENPKSRKPRKFRPKTDTPTTQATDNSVLPQAVSQIVPPDVAPSAPTLDNENSPIAITTNTVTSDPVDFGGELPLGTDILDVYFQDPNDLTDLPPYMIDDSVNSFLDLQSSLGLSDPSNSTGLINPDDSNIQSPAIFQQPNINTPKPNDEVIRTIANPKPAAQESSSSNIKKPGSLRIFSPEHPKQYSLKKFDEIAIKGGMNEDTLKKVHGILNSAGLVAIQQKNGVQRQKTGWLNIIKTFINHYLESMNIHKNRRLKYILGLSKDRAKQSQQSLSPDALNGKTDEEKAAVMQYVGLLAKEFKDTPPLGEVMENARDRFKGDQTALDTVPTILKNTVFKSAGRGKPPQQESQETVTPATQAMANPASSHVICTIDMAHNEQHVGTAAQNSVDRDALEQELKRLRDRIAFLEALL